MQWERNAAGTHWTRPAQQVSASWPWDLQAVRPLHAAMYCTPSDMHIHSLCCAQAGKPLVQHVLQGFNACCFAYGQTGSGKSHTMFGMQGSSSSSGSSAAQPPEQYGLVPRCAQHLFASLARAHPSPSDPSKPSVFVSFLEVYLEQVRDLAFLFSGTAGQSGKRGPGAADPNNLEVYEDPSGMTLVRDLTYIQVRASVCVGQELRCRRDGRSIRGR